MHYETLLHEQRDGVVWITLHRPADRNAVTSRMLEELQGVLSAAKDDVATRVIVLTGAGPAFCAGVDLKELAAAAPGFAPQVQATLALLRHYPKPVIAAINGLTIAGGLELALCCDFLIGAESARIADGHANFCVFPGGGSIAVLPRRIGLARAKQLLYSGEFISATQACAWGLLNEVVPDAHFPAHVAALAAHIAAKSPLLLRRMKAVADQAEDLCLEDAIAAEMRACINHTQSADFREGLAAFREKRTPVYPGE